MTDLLSDSDVTTSGKLVPPRSPSIPKSPDAMPIPALPKRTAGPRRKKSAKEIKSSTSTEIETPPIPNIEQTQSPPVESEGTAPAQSEEYFPEKTETAESKEELNATGEDNTVVTSPEPVVHTHPERAATDDLVSVPPSEAATPPPPSPSVGVTEDDQDEEEDDISSPQKRPTLEIPAENEERHEEAGAQVLTPRAQYDPNDPISSASLAAVAGSLMQPNNAEGGDGDETEEEEAVRKRRFAEKMARLGAVNPFSPGGFVSPVSPSTGKEPKVEEEEGVDDKDESGKEKVSRKKDSTDKDTRDDVAPSAGNESETNVPVLSPSPLSQAHDLTTSTAVAEHTPTQEHYRSSGNNAKHGAQRLESSNDEGGEDDEDDVDVDYPMMSPTAGDFGSHVYSSLNAIERDDEPEPHGAGVAKTSLKHGYAPEEEITAHERVEHTPDPISVSNELELSNQDDVNQFSEEEQDQEQEEEGEQTDMRPARITRAVPPPPRRSSTSSQQSAASSSPRQSPRKAEFERSASPQLTAALSRRAPVPPHRSGSSSSVSPTSSPPPKQFEREGAPSPPSLRALSNIEDEDETEYIEDDSSEALGQPQEGDYVPREGHRVLHDDTRSSSPDHILAQEATRSNSGSPVPRSPPPPVPNNRPPIPKTRRSVPPPPESPPPASGSRPVSRGSMRGVPRGSLDGASPPTTGIEGRRRTSDDDDKATIRKAATRPAMPPPRWEDFQEKEKEIMHDDEGDPVDPGFVRTRTSSQETGTSSNSTPGVEGKGGKQTPQRQSSLRREIHPEAVETPQAEPEEDDETARRRTIAERMAKLGGIKFGMAPPPRAPPVRKMAEPKDRQPEESEASRSQQEAELAGEDGNPEETERSRRAAIAARMAAMGGRGFGMYGAAPPVPPAIISAKPTQHAPTAKAPNIPLAAPPPVPGSRPRTVTKEEIINDAISRAPPVPPPAPLPPVSGKDDDTSESEIELVNAEPDEEGEMVEQEDDEPEMVETPPVVPSRGARPPAHHISRPPPPLPGQSNADNVDQSEASPIPLGRRAPPSRTAPPPASPPSEYDMLGEEPQVVQPHQQAHSRNRPTLNAEPAVPPSLESSGQWELPNIPSGSFDLGNYGSGKRGSTSAAPEHDQSWTKVEQEERLPSNAIPSSSSTTASATEPFAGPAPPSLPADRLALLGRTLARRVLQSAQMVHENSKKLVIGDGSSTSFLYIVLAPTGASTTTLGHLVYAQSGSSVLKRLGDIMPGDVVALYDAHFKGHKGGLGRGGYSVSWGTREDPVLGIISEFDAKKSKIRAFAVNQHPNVYPMIDTPSYKLEDLKSGMVKVFRVAEDPR